MYTQTAAAKTRTGTVVTIKGEKQLIPGYADYVVNYVGNGSWGNIWDRMANGLDRIPKKYFIKHECTVTVSMDTLDDGRKYIILEVVEVCNDRILA